MKLYSVIIFLLIIGCVNKNYKKQEDLVAVESNVSTVSSEDIIHEQGFSEDLKASTAKDNDHKNEDLVTADLELFTSENERPKPEPQKNIQDVKNTKKIEENNLQLNKEKKMELLLSSTLGTIFYSIVLFAAGALIGAPLWSWVSKKFPWNK
jgi:hypothetical protein